MAINVKDLREIMEVLPSKYPLLLQGIHGIGKSEILAQIAKEMGYTPIILFLGQVSDVGDVIGLPDKTPKKIKVKANDEIKELTVNVTNFAPPKWWPLNYNEKPMIILDEMNRAQPEIQNCVMDMTLNGRLNGWQLPDDYRIVGAINPSDEQGTYLVNDLCAAMVDRWVLYDFLPTSEEWMWHGVDQKYHKEVIGFNAKSGFKYLDPPKVQHSNNDTIIKNKVYPSRRSWERVSSTIKEKQDLLLQNKDSERKLRLILNGMVGIEASTHFTNYIKDKNRNMSAIKILNEINDKKLGKEIISKLKGYLPSELIYTSMTIANYFKTLSENRDLIGDDQRPTTDAIKKVSALKTFLDVIQPDLMAWFFSYVKNSYAKNELWAEELCEVDPKLTQKLTETLQGE